MGRTKGDHGAANGENRRRRKNGTGTIEKRGNRWIARWYVQTPQGKVIRKSQTLAASNVAEARECLRELTEDNSLMTREREIRRNLDALDGVAAERREWEENQPSYTFEEAWDAFDEDGESKRRDPATQRNYQQWFGMFARWTAANHPEVTELRRVTSRIAAEYSRYLLGKVRGTTFNRHFNALALIWYALAAHGADGEALHPNARLGANPFAYDKRTDTGIKRVKLSKGEKPHRRRDLTLEEMAVVLKAAQGELLVLLALGFYTGLRLGDCATLEWANIDRVNGIITRISNKTGTETHTRINPALAKIMEANITTAKRTGFLLPRIAALYNGGTNGRVKLVHEITNIFRAAGICTSYKADGDRRARPDCGFHSLRHTFITQLERLGATIEERKKLAGHNTAQMTAYYTHNDGNRVLDLPDLTDETIDAEAATSHTEPQANAETRLQAFKAAFAALTDAERTAAAAWIAEQNRVTA